MEHATPAVNVENARVYHAYDGKKPKSSVSSMATMAKMQ